MTRPSPNTAAKSEMLPCVRLGSNGALVAQSTSSSAGVVSPPLAAPAPFCPDCGGPFSYRITDEDTGCRLPVDDGEHYCEGCDSLWTDDYLIGADPVVLSEGWARVEL